MTPTKPRELRPQRLAIGSEAGLARAIAGRIGACDRRRARRSARSASPPRAAIAGTRGATVCTAPSRLVAICCRRVDVFARPARLGTSRNPGIGDDEIDPVRAIEFGELLSSGARLRRHRSPLLDRRSGGPACFGHEAAPGGRATRPSATPGAVQRASAGGAPRTARRAGDHHAHGLPAGERSPAGRSLRSACPCSAGATDDRSRPPKIVLSQTVDDGFREAMQDRRVSGRNSARKDQRAPAASSSSDKARPR